MGFLAPGLGASGPKPALSPLWQAAGQPYDYLASTLVAMRASLSLRALSRGHQGDRKSSHLHRRGLLQSHRSFAMTAWQQPGKRTGRTVD